MREVAMEATGFAAKAGRDFSGDCYPASREIKQERRSA
jgi:hypothetical protein